MWRHLSEITLSQDSFNPGEQIPEQIYLDLDLLDLPQGIYLRLAGSIADAMKNAEVSPDHAGRIESLLIQVFVQIDNQDGETQRGDKMIAEFNLLQEGEFAMRGQQSSEPHKKAPEIYQGWGFFVVEKMVAGEKISADTLQYEIRIFLYKEGAKN